MALKIWALDTCAMQAVSDPDGVSVWNSHSGVFYHGGSIFRVCPLCMYYGDTKLTKVATSVELSGQNTWFWGDLDGLNSDTVYVNVGIDPDNNDAEVLYSSTMTEVIESTSTKDRIVINARISNNSNEIVQVRTALYTSGDVYVSNILPTLTVPVGKLVDDNSRLAVPIGYKYKVEASSVDVSILVSGDEY